MLHYVLQDTLRCNNSTAPESFSDANWKMHAQVTKKREQKVHRTL